MIDRRFIGQSFPSLTVDVEPGRLRAFARATAQTDPIYWEKTVAQAAGYRDIPAPLTFLFTLDLEREDPFYFINEMKIDLARVLHGEQGFTYGAPICAGDRVTLTSSVTDIYDKKDGALEFVTLLTQARNQFGEDLGTMTRSIVVREAAPLKSAPIKAAPLSNMRFEDAEPGDGLPPITQPEICRSTLALFAGASGDHNPIHIDIDFAKSAGMPDVFAHGMLGMAYLGQLLTNWVPQRAVRAFSTRFVAITQLHAVITCSGRVVAKREGNLVALEIQAADQHGEVKLAGQALVELP